MRIALIGYRGSGKTTAGRLLARNLGTAFVDTDEMIVERAGKTIREIFQQQGEAVFRDLETAAVREACRIGDAVIALGGGALGREENRRAVASAGTKLICLRCDEQILLERIRGDPATTANRPDLTGLAGGIEEIRRVLAERQPVWRRCMDAEIDVSQLGPEQVVAEILKIVQDRP